MNSPTATYANCFQGIISSLYDEQELSFESIEHILRHNLIINRIANGGLLLASMPRYDLLERIYQAEQYDKPIIKIDEHVPNTLLASPAGWTGRVLGTGIGSYDMSLSTMLNKSSLRTICDNYPVLHNDSMDVIFKELFDCEISRQTISSVEAILIPQKQLHNICSRMALPFSPAYAYITGVHHMLGLLDVYEPLDDNLPIQVFRASNLLLRSTTLKWPDFQDVAQIQDKYDQLTAVTVPLFIEPFNLPFIPKGIENIVNVCLSQYLPQLVLAKEELASPKRELIFSAQKREQEAIQAFDEINYTNSLITNVCNIYQRAKL